MRTVLVGVCLGLVCACSRGGGGAEGGGDPGAPPAQPPAPTATPVTVAPVARKTLAVTVSGPGNTEALAVEDVRAPFAGTMVDLRVQVGDHVTAGQVLGYVESRESAAALEGARAMERGARTAQERSDAARALVLAEKNRVSAAVRAPAAGVVVARRVSPGALVAQDEGLLTIAATGAIVFVARIDQSDLARVRPGQEATVEIPALGAAQTGRVHAIVPAVEQPGAAAPAAFSADVRIDFTGARRPQVPGLFGTAGIVVEQVKDAQVVPAVAVLRNDVTGVTRVATVSDGGTAHWVDAKTGVTEGGDVQIVSPALPPGARVITTNLVGLPEGTKVQVQP